MIRRFVLWTAILFVLVGGVLTGHRSVAQGDDAMLRMVVYECEPNSTHCPLMIQDPVSQSVSPLSRDQLLGYLRDGSLLYDFADELYQWRDYSPEFPLGVFIVEAVAGQYYKAEQGLIWRTWAQPSPDWQWVVYRIFDDLYAVNLDDGKPHSVLTGTGLHLEGDWLHVVFDPDGEWFYTNAVDSQGNQGVYRLRLDGTNLAMPQPIMPDNYVPLLWLEDAEMLVVERAFNSDLLLLKTPEFTYRNLWVETDEYSQLYFVDWRPQDNTVIAYSDHLSANPSVSLFGLNIDPNMDERMRWGVLQWQPIGISQDREWLFVLQDERIIGRVRTDGSQLQTIATIPEEIMFVDNRYQVAISPDGNWVAGAAYEALFLVDVANQDIRKLDAIEGFDHMEWSPDSQRLFCWQGYFTLEGSEMLVYSLNGTMRQYEWSPGRGFVAWLVLEDTP